MIYIYIYNHAWSPHSSTTSAATSWSCPPRAARPARPAAPLHPPPRHRHRWRRWRGHGARPKCVRLKNWRIFEIYKVKIYIYILVKSIYIYILDIHTITHYSIQFSWEILAKLLGKLWFMVGYKITGLTSRSIYWVWLSENGWFNQQGYHTWCTKEWDIMGHDKSNYHW